MKRQNSDDLSDQPVKKRKLISEDDLDLNSVKNANMSDVYSTNLVPYDIVCNHIVPHHELGFMYQKNVIKLPSSTCLVIHGSRKSLQHDLGYPYT
jgi:hypothetical protein